MCQTAGALIAGGATPQNVLQISPRDITQRHCQVPLQIGQLAMIQENTDAELEPPTSSAYNETTIDSLPRVLPHHGYSLGQRVVDLMHCLGPRKMNGDQVRQNVMSTGCRVVLAKTWSNTVLALHQVSNELLLLQCVALCHMHTCMHAVSTTVHRCYHVF